MAILAMSILAAAAAAQAQPVNELRLYGRGNFSGPSISAMSARRGIAPFTVKSVQMPAGTGWELCSGQTFTGCKAFSASDPKMVMTVRSVRPVAGPIVRAVGGLAPATGITATAVAADGASLRGMASEFFVTPGQGAARIEADQASANGRATEFCRARGWRSSVHARVQAIGGRSYLADVLCSDE